MRFWYVLVMVGLLIWVELVRAYWGGQDHKPAWLRGMSYGAVVLMAIFAIILVQRVIFVLDTY